jgi:3-oxoadipate enol-lactonase
MSEVIGTEVIGTELTASLTGPDDLPVLVLGNSLGTSRMVWDRQVPALGERFRLLRYELPGHGGAAYSGGPIGIGELGAGVLSLLDRYGVERAAYCGISLGGMVGMWLAAHAPDRIGSLGLVCTSAYLPPASGWQDRAAKVRAEGMGSVVEQSIGRWFPPSFAASEPALMESFAAELAAADPAGYAACCLAIAGMDLRGDLAGVKAPTLVISGADDAATPPEHGAAIAEGVGPAGTGTARHIITGGAHLANVSSAGEVTNALADHLRVTMQSR